MGDHETAPSEGPNGSREAGKARLMASSRRWTMKDKRQNRQTGQTSIWDLMERMNSTPGAKGEARGAAGERAESFVSPRGNQSPTGPLTTEALPPQVMQEVLDPENLKEAMAKVKANKGAPGIDGMTVEQLPGYLQTHLPGIKQQLLEGTYKPQPVRRVEIPKPDGGVRKLGIPTVLDRFIQQAVQQVLTRRWDPTFSQSSFGFRPGRSAHQAVETAQRHIADGCAWVVDIDLEKFFDRVNHDRLKTTRP